MSSDARSGTIAWVNNSRETFTPTVSGAIATCIHEVARAAMAEGYACPVVTRPAPAEPHDWPDLHLTPAARDGGALHAKALRARRRLTGWARPDQWAYAADVLDRVRRIAPRVVVVNNDPEIAVHLRAKLPGVRVVHWFHNLELAGDRFRRRFAADPDLRSVAVSGYLARAVEQVYGLTPLSVAAVLNGVSARDYPTDRAPGVPAIPTIGYLGRLAVEKAPDTLVRAGIILARRGVEFRLQLAGDTNWGFTSKHPFHLELDRLLAELESLGIEVVRTGHLARDEVPRALTRTDVHVTPSRWDEPCGLTTLEGLASARAVVGSATGGTPELLHGAGRIFPRDDDAALADVLEELVRDRDLREDLGRRARERAEALTWERTWDGLARAAGVRRVGE
jgi:glycosyltransferase involved in cell wall biosynthesis